MFRRYPHELPRCWPTSRLLGAVLLRLLGWRVEGGPPQRGAKAVLIAAPHTSNWDYFYALLAGWTFGVSFQWMGKDALFRPPLGWLLRLLGGVPVDRSAPQGLVAVVAERFRTSERMLLMVPAEGTRAYRPYWKSGFYHMARAAEVPVILGWLDYGRRVAGLGTTLALTGDTGADMDRIRAFYEGKQGLYPACVSRIRLRLEDGPEDAGAEAPRPGGDAPA